MIESGMGYLLLSVCLFSAVFYPYTRVEFIPYPGHFKWEASQTIVSFQGFIISQVAEVGGFRARPQAVSSGLFLTALPALLFALSFP